MIVLCVITIIVTREYRFRPNLLDNAVGYAATPLSGAASSVIRWVGGVFDHFGDINDIRAENTKLRERVEELTTENKRLKLVEEESEKLTSLLKIDEKYPEYPKTGARLVARDTSNWFSSFIIDKGENDGFTENLVVLAPGGLAGRILKAGDTYSEVLSIIDSASSVSVQSARAGDLGVLRGDLELMKDGLCRMDYIDVNARVMEGDELITSRLSDIFPAGITVGYVKEIRMDARALVKYAIVRPAVDIQSIDAVMVISEPYSSFDPASKDALTEE
jgi:rod shape-determining protein MreC